jgi:hypothetical protein
MTTIPIPLPPGTTPVTDKWQVNGDDVFRLFCGTAHRIGDWWPRFFEGKMNHTRVILKVQPPASHTEDVQCRIADVRSNGARGAVG